jgi:hypothetical protein
MSRVINTGVMICVLSSWPNNILKLTRQEIPLSSIEEVYQTRNPLSAPAWSLDRLRINYCGDDKSGFALISPKDEIRFMQEIVDNGLGLKMQGDRVIRVRQ